MAGCIGGTKVSPGQSGLLHGELLHRRQERWLLALQDESDCCPAGCPCGIESRPPCAVAQREGRWRLLAVLRRAAAHPHCQLNASEACARATQPNAGGSALYVTRIVLRISFTSTRLSLGLRLICGEADRPISIVLALMLNV
ncbi:MAG: hypothetical protein H6880_05040 [Rhodobiaceae bacterium]|nr:hypothetical protein [Rhodobiaceae bacterium]